MFENRGMKTLIIFAISFLLLSCTEDTVSEDFKDFLSSESAKIEGGTWLTSCLATQGGGTQKRTASYLNGTFTESLTSYSDTCSTKTTELVTTGSYVIGDAISVNNSARKLDRIIMTYTVTPNASLAASYNAAALCGLTNWAAGVPVDILGRTCNGSLMPSAGYYHYDIFSVSIFESNSLRFGYTDSTYDGSTPAKRPTTLLAYPVYQR